MADSDGELAKATEIGPQMPVPTPVKLDIMSLGNQILKQLTLQVMQKAMEAAQARKALLKAAVPNDAGASKVPVISKRTTGKQPVEATPSRAAAKRDRGTPSTDKTPSTSTPNPKRSVVSEATPDKMDTSKTPKKSLMSDLSMGATPPPRAALRGCSSSTLGATPGHVAEARAIAMRSLPSYESFSSETTSGKDIIDETEEAELMAELEVTHTPSGAAMIKNFVLKVVGCKGEWNMHDFCQRQIDIIMNKLEDKYVVGAVSGGVDSSVAAALVHKAIGDRFRPFMVDTGLLRKDEAKIVKERLEKHIPGMKLKLAIDLPLSDAFKIHRLDKRTMQLLRLLSTLCAVAHTYRISVSDGTGGTVTNTTSKTSIRAFTWRGFTDYAHFAVKDVGEVKVEKPFLSLPNPTQNNPCKLLVHKDASHTLIQPASTTKKHIVSAIKAQLVEICKLTYAKPNARNYHQQTLKRCAALDLGTDARLEQDEEAAAADDEEELMTGPVEAVAALQDSVSSAVTTYGCLALQGHDLDNGISVKKSDHVHRGFRHIFKTFVSNMKGGVLGRLAKKLAGYTHGACAPFSDCPKWLKLLRHMANAEIVEGVDACKEHLISKGLMELKGVSGTRVAAIDLTKLPLTGQRREVRLVHEGAELALEIQNDLGVDDEAVTKVSLAQDTQYAEVSSPWSELEDIISKRIQAAKNIHNTEILNYALQDFL
ncbi:GMP synthase [glutamine-hydrolyzing] [Symbiodinium microadriaticum]|uniref:GMP synthase [glutamine-hydrolyzing] n=1 Tax=Symbiodinium microadriaticum TaxID=2951 RepID=A0A1Q9EPG2_SYMMI|nr:GMP synthase [glutamine-hydrolyzing] [Symbiodinium microadriaticum]